jgi:GntR family transcriptional regulator
MTPTSTKLPSASIDRSSPVPYYFQLANLLQEEITSGRWAIGERIASEPVLGRHFDVSRATVRQALLMLQNEGHLSREKGRGTFVAEPSLGSWLLQSPEGFLHQEADRLGHKVKSTLLRVEREPLPRWAAQHLNLETGADGMTIERVREVDGEPVLYVVNHLPGALGETLETFDESESLYELLRRREGLKVYGGRRSVEAVNAGKQVSRLLGIKPTTALALIESVSWSHDLKPFDCYRAWLRTDRLRIDIAVTASSNQSHGR